MACAPSSLGGGVKKVRKVFAGGIRNFYFGGGGGGGGGGGYCSGGGGGRGILKENLKLDNPSIISTFRITSLIYFRCIKNTH